MIKCKHKHQYAAINRGFMVQFCRKHGKLVNDTICRNCKDQDGSFDPQPVIETDFLERSAEEIKATYRVCSGCPMFEAQTQTCKSRPGEILPVDIISQNPSEHCPENQW